MVEPLNYLTFTLTSTIVWIEANARNRDEPSLRTQRSRFAAVRPGKLPLLPGPGLPTANPQTLAKGNPAR